MSCSRNDFRVWLNRTPHHFTHLFAIFAGVPPIHVSPVTPMLPSHGREPCASPPCCDTVRTHPRCDPRPPYPKSGRIGPQESTKTKTEILACPPPPSVVLMAAPAGVAPSRQPSLTSGSVAADALWGIFRRFHDIWVDHHKGLIPKSEDGPGRSELNAWAATHAVLGPPPAAPREFNMTQVSGSCVGRRVPHRHAVAPRAVQSAATAIATTLSVTTLSVGSFVPNVWFWCVQIKRQYLMFKVQPKDLTTPNVSVQGSASARTVQGPDDYATRVSLRVNAAADKVASVAVSKLRASPLCEIGPLAVLYADAVDRAVDGLRAAARTHVTDVLLPLIVKHRPSTAAKAHDSDRGFQSGVSTAAITKTVRWGADASVAMAAGARPDTLAATLLHPRFAGSTHDDRCVQAIGSLLLQHTYEELCAALAGASGPVLLDLPNEDGGQAGPGRRTNQYRDGGEYPVGSALAYTVCYVAGWIVIRMRRDSAGNRGSRPAVSAGVRHQQHGPPSGFNVVRFEAFALSWSMRNDVGRDVALRAGLPISKIDDRNDVSQNGCCPSRAVYLMISSRRCTPRRVIRRSSLTGGCRCSNAWPRQHWTASRLSFCSREPALVPARPRRPSLSPTRPQRCTDTLCWSAHCIIVSPPPHTPTQSMWHRSTPPCSHPR